MEMGMAKNARIKAISRYLVKRRFIEWTIRCHYLWAFLPSPSWTYFKALSGILQINYLWIISSLVEKRNLFLSEKGVFSRGSSKGRFPLYPRGPMPGQKDIRLAQKGGGSSFPNAGFCALPPSHPLPPASLCGKEEGGKWKGLIPAVFVFADCPFARATSKRVRTTNLIRDDPF